MIIKFYTYFYFLLWCVANKKNKFHIAYLALLITQQCRQIVIIVFRYIVVLYIIENRVVACYKLFFFIIHCPLQDIEIVTLKCEYKKYENTTHSTLFFTYWWIILCICIFFLGVLLHFLLLMLVEIPKFTT
jgi:hypothetical protein